jgi:RNA polymerase sigma-70 factor (ECF subfamily)
VNPAPTPAPSEAAKPPVPFRALFEAEFRYVWNSLRYLGVRPADVQDVGQEVFLTVHRRLAAGEVPRSTRSWVFSLCYHAASNYRRLARHRREVPTDPAPDAPDPASDAEARLARQQELARLAEALDALDLDRRAVLVMHDMDEVAMPEVAEALGIPLNTAYSRLRLARRDFVAAARRVGLHGGGK